ncbi:DUF7282 domain-containing protein [Halocatena pleomorpha]|uniref:DUF7282 domain-containing protein n=1 Tax=Halocatena pleomorpha TaxID=1785090 RepID=A0A3P3RFH3_9EURY|nr:hypothetical protein [Halocatena pleomorpha]RRJ31183.1 hypothetical protein EIK79_08100 [Halocatena pleomorpha]
MRYNLTETHIAGIAAAVLAIVIIVVAVGLMSVAQPSDGGNSTLSPAVGSVTETASPETHTPGFTPAPTTTSVQTSTSTAEPSSTEPPPTNNQGVDPNKVSVTPMCTDANSGEAWYEVSNKNSETATVSFSSTAGGVSDSITVQGGGGSAEISIPATNGNALVIELPGTNNGQHDGTRYQPASKACSGGIDGGTGTGTDDGTNNGSNGGTDNSTDGGTDNSTDDGTDGSTGPTPTVSLSDQTSSDDQTVTVDQASLPNGGFVVLSTEDNPRVATSQNLGAGTKQDIQIGLPQKIDEEKTFTAAIYNDTNGNSQLDENDMPYTNKGSVVSDTATVTPSSDEGGGGLFGLN